MLVERVSRGDVEALSLLYDRHARAVYAFAAHAIGHSDAEEVVQDCFVRLWRRAGQFDARRGSFTAWFMAIAQHRVVDELRRRGKGRIAAEQIESVLVEAVDPAADPEEEAWQRTRSDRLVQALRELPAEQRRVLVLAYFGGLSQSEIAAGFGLPLGTVKKRIRLGLQKLRTAFAEGAQQDSEGQHAEARES